MKFSIISFKFQYKISDIEIAVKQSSISSNDVMSIIYKSMTNLFGELIKGQALVFQLRSIN